MSDRQLQTAFQHLQEDVMNNVPTEQRLAEITVRRTPGRTAFVAFAAGAAAVLVIGAVLFAIRPGGGADTVPPATQTTGTPAPTTETTAETTATSSSETTQAVLDAAPTLPDLLPGMTLVASPDISSTEPGDGVLEAVTFDIATIGFDVDRVVSDKSDGVFFQVGNTIGWLRPDLPAINLFSAGDLPTSESVEIRLEDVATIDGETNIIFVVSGGENEQRYEEVWRYEVGTGAPYSLYHTGAYEGSIRRASIENDVMVVTRWAEGFSWFEFFNTDGQPIDVSNPKTDAAEFPLSVDQGVLSPDGAILAYLEADTFAPENGSWPVDVVVFDLRDGIEDRRVTVDLGDWYVDRMDYDALGAVIGRWQYVGEAPVAGPPLGVTLGESAAEIHELDVSGVPSLVK